MVYGFFSMHDLSVSLMFGTEAVGIISTEQTGARTTKVAGGVEDGIAVGLGAVGDASKVGVKGVKVGTAVAEGVAGTNN